MGYKYASFDAADEFNVGTQIKNQDGIIAINIIIEPSSTMNLVDFAMCDTKCHYISSLESINRSSRVWAK
jgi:hypothetical protein